MMLRSLSLGRLARPSARVAFSRRQALARDFATAKPFAANPISSTSKGPDASVDPAQYDQVTTLSNGLRVATESLPGPFSAVGVYIDAGSRYEDERLRGLSHIIDRLAFKSTKTRTVDTMIENMEMLGGNIQCASGRESLNYQCASFNAAVPTVVGLLADTIRNPLITQEEVEQQLETAAYEIREIEDKPELILPEYVHMTAYKDNTLGNPLLCPKDRLNYIDRQTVLDYRQFFYKPERIVIAFAGVAHDEAVKLTEQYFGDMRRSQHETIRTPSLSPSLLDSGKDSLSQRSSSHEARRNLSTSASQSASILSTYFGGSPTHADDVPYSLNLQIPSHYTGGFSALPHLPPPPNPAMPALSHVHLAFEALPIHSTDIYALATLQILLGGGGSFSAGGPGKGMYSRIFTNVLNQHYWMESCVAFNHSYTDSGLFGIAASCQPGHTRPCLEAMCAELIALTRDSGSTALKEGEVLRAKNQLRSSLLMNLESRIVELEDLGRQVQVHGRRVGVREMCAMIEALTVQDLRRVAREVLFGKVDNMGKGLGGPTLIIQEGEVEGRRVLELEMGEAWERIARSGLGRKGFAS